MNRVDWILLLLTIALLVAAVAVLVYGVYQQ